MVCRKINVQSFHLTYLLYLDFNNVGNNGENILHIAARSKSINEDAYRATTTNDSDNQQSSLLIYLLSTMNDKAKPIVNINQRDNQGRTPLHHAVMASRIANVKILIDYGASIIVNIVFPLIFDFIDFF